MKEVTAFVGLDSHKKTIQVALLAPGSRVPVEWEVQNEPAAVRRLGELDGMVLFPGDRVSLSQNSCPYLSTLDSIASPLEMDL